MDGDPFSASRFRMTRRAQSGNATNGPRQLLAELRANARGYHFDVVFRRKRVAGPELAGPGQQSRIALVRIHKHMWDHRLEHQRLQKSDAIELFQSDFGDDGV